MEPLLTSNGAKKIPYFAIEVLCSDIWSIVETRVNRSEEPFAPFWRPHLMGMGRLICLLSPAHSSGMHTVVSELIKGIVSTASPSPGAGLTEGLQNGPASNSL